jgi:hypothetical protein
MATAKLAGPRVLVVGAGSPNADFVAHVLEENGFVASWTDKLKFPDPLLLRKFSVVYGIYLQSCSRYILIGRLLGKRTIIHFVGSDAYWFAREKSLWRRLYWRITMRATDLVFYVSPHLMQFVPRPGIVLPFPIDANEFKSPDIQKIKPERDVLYYCPSGEINERIYRLSWIVEYARSHPDEKITVIGSKAHPANYRIPIPNVDVVPFVAQSEMPALYRRHRRLIRMTLEDGLPRMPHEALLSGIEVVYNGEQVTEVPSERDPRQFALSFANAVASIHISRE